MNRERAFAVKAFLFPSDREDLLVVSVPSLNGATEVYTLDDLDLSPWWTYPLKRDEFVVCLEDYRYQLRRFPLDSRLTLKHPYTVCWEGKNVDNLAIQRLSGGKIKETPGSMMVFKHDESGRPIDVEERDKALVFTAVLNLLEFGVIP